MWRLLRAELSIRSMSILCWIVGLVLLLAGMLLITKPDVPVLSWCVSLLAMVPLLINFTAGVNEAQEHRLNRQVILPIPLVQIGMARFMVPVLVQLFGGLLATLFALAGSIVGRANGNWLIAAWMTCVFLVLNQNIFTQRELQANRNQMLAAGIRSYLISTLMVAIVTALFVFFAYLYNQAMNITSATNTNWQVQLPYLTALCAVTSVLFVANLALFLRRDLAHD